MSHLDIQISVKISKFQIYQVSECEMEKSRTEKAILRNIVLGTRKGEETGKIIRKKKTITMKVEDKQVPVMIREEMRRYEAVKVMKYSVIDLVKRIQGDSGLEDKYLWTCE